MKSTFDSIGPRYEIVARTLGCSVWKAFFRVTLPVAKSGVVAAGILAWARAVGEYGATVTLAGATQMKTETLPIAIYLNMASAEGHGKGIGRISIKGKGLTFTGCCPNPISLSEKNF